MRFLAPSTRATAQSLMRNHGLPYFGRRALGSVTQIDVQAFVSHLQASGLVASTVRKPALSTGFHLVGLAGFEPATS